MEKDVQIIDTSVILKKFSPLRAKLQKMADDASKVTAKDFADKAKMALVKTNQLSLRDARVELEKIGKMLRDPHTDFNRQVKIEEEDLISLIEPEEKRLKAIRAEADELTEREARKVALPSRREQIKEIDDEETVSDEILLDMDSAGFSEYLNTLRVGKLEEQRLAMEEAQIREAEALAAERRAMDEERAEIEKEKQRLVHEKEVQEAAENARIEERKRAEQAEKERIEREARERKETEERALRMENERIEREAREALAKQAELEAKKKYQNFLAKYEYVDDGSFKIENDGSTVSLYKCLGTMKL